MPLPDDVPVRRRSSPRADATRQRQDAILDVALAAFAERGFHGTSLRDVAARAGMSQSGLLHHYPEKTALLEAVLDREERLSQEQYRWEVVDGRTFLEHLITSTAVHLERPAGAGFLVSLTAESGTPGHPAHGYFVARYARLAAGVARALDDLRARGGLADPTLDTAMAARQVLAVSDGLQVQWLLDPATDVVAGLRMLLDSWLVEPLAGDGPGR